MSDNNILVFSQGRSGGGTIQFALNNIVETRIVTEELEHHVRPIQRELINRDPSVPLTELPHEPYIRRLRNHLDEYMEKSDGIKHNINNFSVVAESRGCKTGLWHKLDKMVVDYFEKVIINDRKNWLKWAVSFELGKYTGEYGIDDENQKEEYIQEVNQLDPFEVDIERIRDKMLFFQEEWRKRINYIEQNDIPHFYLTYENLYNCPHENRVEMFKNALKFLDLEFNEERAHKIRHLFKRVRKVSGKDVNYHLIENIDELNEELGPKFGFLY